jgi:hypothetical protein
VRLDAKHVVHQSGFEKLDGHRAYHEMKAAYPAISKNPAVLYTERAQKFGAAAFKETQIGGVIDATGKIRVLVIDPHSEAVG